MFNYTLVGEGSQLDVDPTCIVAWPCIVVDQPPEIWE